MNEDKAVAIAKYRSKAECIKSGLKLILENGDDCPACPFWRNACLFGSNSSSAQRNAVARERAAAFVNGKIVLIDRQIYEVEEDV